MEQLEKTVEVKIVIAKKKNQIKKKNAKKEKEKNYQNY